MSVAYGMASLEQLYENVRRDMDLMKSIELFVANSKKSDDGKHEDEVHAKEIIDRAVHVANKCQQTRKRRREECDETVDNELLVRAHKFLCGHDLRAYDGYLQHVPSTVNVVSRVVTKPRPGFATTVPLDLNRLVSRCPGAYYWLAQFCRAQMAFHSIPRTRMLIFDNGKFLGIGSRGTTSARLAVMLAVENLAKDADIHLEVTEFTVTNLVGTVQLGATVNCEGMAKEFSIETDYDKSSFVAMMWRPFERGVDGGRKGICCEVYSTGNMNIPGALTYKQMLKQFGELHPVFLRFSSIGDPSVAALPTTDEANYEETFEEAVNSYGMCDNDMWDGWQ